MHSTYTSYVLCAYLYCVDALVGGAFSIRDPYICAVHKSVTRCLPQARCLCSENVVIGFKTSIEAYFVGKKQCYDAGAARGEQITP